jgi:hypothetical protein
MNCPPELADTLLSLVQIGVLRIRSSAWEWNAEQCGIEADHIHNLPDLIVDYSPDKLAYYWNVERPEYVKQVPEDRLAGWEPVWQQLSEKLEALDHSGSCSLH